MIGYDIPLNDEIGINFENFNVAEELKKFDDYTPKPTDILIRLYVPPIKSAGGIYMNNSKAVYTEIAGYVAKLGSCCFKGERYKDWGKWYKEGDWVLIPRHAGIRFTYNNLPVFTIEDDAPFARIKDPRLAK